MGDNETIHRRINYGYSGAVSVAIRGGIPDIVCRYWVSDCGLQTRFDKLDTVDGPCKAGVGAVVTWDSLGIEASKLVMSCYNRYQNFEGLLANNPLLFDGKPMMYGEEEVTVASNPSGDPQALRVMIIPGYLWVQVDHLRPIRPYKKLIPLDLKSAVEHEGRYFYEESSPGAAYTLVGFAKDCITYTDIHGKRHDMTYAKLADCRWWDTKFLCRQEVDA